MLIFALVVSQVSIVTAAESDMEGHWAKESVQQWLDMGLANGYPDGSFKPNQDITRAEFVTLLDNVFGFIRTNADAYKDVDANAYYAEAVYGASTADVITGYNGNFRPNDPITREEAATAVARAYQLSEPAGMDYLEFTDAIAVSTWAEDAVQALVEEGYMQGVGSNMLDPKSNITRASALTLIGNVFGTYVSEAKEVTGVINGNLFIASDDVVLKDAEVKGSVFVAPSVGNGDVTIDSTTIDGELVAMGGGENSIRLFNSIVSQLIVKKVGGKVRVYAEGTSRINNVALYSGAKLEEGSGTGTLFNNVEILNSRSNEVVTLAGKFAKVNVLRSIPELNVLNGTIDEMDFAGESDNTKVNLSLGAVIRELRLKTRVEIEGSGKIIKATVEKSNSIIDVTVEQVRIEGDNVVVKVDGKDVNQDVDNPTGGSGSNGGGSNGGGSSDSYRRLSVAIDNYDSDRFDQAFSIYGSQSGDIDFITAEVMKKVLDNFDTYYDEYNGEGTNVLASLLIGGVDVFQYVTQEDLNQTEHFANFDISANYPNKDKKKLTYNVLNYVYNQIKAGTDVSDYEADMKLIASKVALGEVTYKNEPFVSVTIKKGTGSNQTTLASYAEGGDKAAFVENVFNELSNIGMTSNATYEIELVRKDNAQNKTLSGSIVLTSN